MRSLFLLSALALPLAACATTAPQPMAAPVAVNTKVPGVYYWSGADDVEGRTVVRADGRYVEYLDGDQVAAGVWRIENGNKCFDPDKEGAAAVCYADGPVQTDGSWLSTGCDGLTYTMRYEAL